MNGGRDKRFAGQSVWHFVFMELTRNTYMICLHGSKPTKNIHHIKTFEEELTYTRIMEATEERIYFCRMWLNAREK